MFKHDTKVTSECTDLATQIDHVGVVVNEREDDSITVVHLLHHNVVHVLKTKNTSEWSRYISS